jgi:hypothetical protein
MHATAKSDGGRNLAGRANTHLDRLAGLSVACRGSGRSGLERGRIVGSSFPVPVALGAIGSLSNIDNNWRSSGGVKAGSQENGL